MKSILKFCQRYMEVAIWEGSSLMRHIYKRFFSKIEELRN